MIKRGLLLVVMAIDILDIKVKFVDNYDEAITIMILWSIVALFIRESVIVLVSDILLLIIDDWFKDITACLIYALFVILLFSILLVKSNLLLLMVAFLTLINPCSMVASLI